MRSLEQQNIFSETPVTLLLQYSSTSSTIVFTLVRLQYKLKLLLNKTKNSKYDLDKNILKTVVVYIKMQYYKCFKQQLCKNVLCSNMSVIQSLKWSKRSYKIILYIYRVFAYRWVTVELHSGDYDEFARCKGHRMRYTHVYNIIVLTDRILCM